MNNYSAVWADEVRRLEESLESFVNRMTKLVAGDENINKLTKAVRRANENL